MNRAMEINADKPAAAGGKGKIVFFGCPLDVDERDESIQEKRAGAQQGLQDPDPYAGVMRFIAQEVAPDRFDTIGSLDIPGWLHPMPGPDERAYINVDNFVSFIDQNQCRTFAGMIGEHVVDEILPEIPCMIAVDHSLTGGVFERIAARYGPDAVSLVVLDSHTDALPMSVLSGAIGYDMDTNPESVHDPDDPFLQDRADSFNASSFLYHLLEEGVIRPHNLYLLGVSDYPSKRSFRIKDPRIRRYVGLYAGLKKKGVTILTKRDLKSGASKVRSVLAGIKTPYIYVSVDMDIGAGNALEGIRFRNWKGINEKQLYAVAGHLQDVLTRGGRLVGMDLTEFNPRRIDAADRTYRIGANLIKKLCFDHKGDC